MLLLFRLSKKPTKPSCIRGIMAKRITRGGGISVDYCLGNTAPKNVAAGDDAVSDLTGSETNPQPSSSSSMSLATGPLRQFPLSSAFGTAQGIICLTLYFFQLSTRNSAT